MNRRVLQVIFSAMACLSVSCVPASARDFYGLMDKSGKFIVPADYREIKQQKDGTYAVTTFGKENVSREETFVVDQYGRRIADRKPDPGHSNILMFTTAPRLEYEEAHSYDDRLGSLYGLRNKKTGRMSIPFRSIKELLAYPVGEDLFIDQKQIGEKTETLLLKDGGEVIAKIPNLLSSPNLEFINGLMLAENAEREYGFFDKKGKLLCNRYFETADRFTDGVASVSFRQDGVKYGAVIDQKGDYVYGPHKNIIVSPFFNGIASIEVLAEDKSSSTSALKSAGRGVLNRKFEVLIPPQYEYVKEYGNHLVAKLFASSGGGWVVFDFAGKKLLELESTVSDVRPSDDSNVVAFAEGVDTKSTGATTSSAKWGFVNFAGKEIVPPKFDDAMSFVNGVAVVSVKDTSGKMQSGTIDELGKFVVQPKFKNIIPTKPLAIVVDERDGGFDPYAWANPDLSGFLNRYEQWHAFLREYDLIGMERTEVFKLLGDDRVLHSRGHGRSTLPDAEVVPSNGITSSAKNIFYGLNSTICGNASSSLEVEFGDDDKVSRYRIVYGGDRDQPWILDNRRAPGIGAEDHAQN